MGPELYNFGDGLGFVLDDHVFMCRFLCRGLSCPHQRETEGFRSIFNHLLAVTIRIKLCK